MFVQFCSQWVHPFQNSSFHWRLCLFSFKVDGKTSSLEVGWGRFLAVGGVYCCRLMKHQKSVSGQLVVRWSAKCIEFLEKSAKIVFWAKSGNPDGPVEMQ